MLNLANYFIINNDVLAVTATNLSNGLAVATVLASRIT